MSREVKVRYVGPKGTNGFTLTRTESGWQAKGLGFEFSGETEPPVDDVSALVLVQGLAAIEQEATDRGWFAIEIAVDSKVTRFDAEEGAGLGRLLRRTEEFVREILDESGSQRVPPARG